MKRGQRVTAPIKDEAYSRALITWKMGVVLLAIWAVALVGTWQAWSRAMRRQLDRELAGWRARGEPSSIAELHDEPIAPEENAATYLRQVEFSDAGKLYEKLDETDDLDKHPLSADAQLAIGIAVTANQKNLELLHRAESCRGINWGWRQLDQWERSGPSLNQMRAMANLLGRDACNQAQQGHVNESMQAIADTLYLARAAGSVRMVVGELVADGIEHLAANAASECAWQLPERKLSDRERAAMRRVVGELLNDRVRKEQARGAEEYEMLWTMNLSRDLVGDRWIYPGAGQNKMVTASPWDEALFAPARAIQMRGSARAMPLAEQAIADMTRETWSTRVLSRGGSSIPSRTWTQPLDYVASQAYSTFYDPGRWIRAAYRARAARHLAAAALAANGYRMDHGSYPESLQAILPEYMADVPSDPYSPNGGTIGYSLRGEPYIYSVFENGVDDTATTPPQRSMSGDWRGMDYYFFISRAKAAATGPSATSRRSN